MFANSAIWFQGKAYFHNPIVCLPEASTFQPAHDKVQQALKFPHFDRLQESLDHQRAPVYTKITLKTERHGTERARIDSKMRNEFRICYSAMQRKRSLNKSSPWIYMGIKIKMFRLPWIRRMRSCCSE
eukprot:TRINITY_DN31882_c0_g1_i1.p1 TRINITY_DN31882_c0_g1~~TRINITY_DN31882_c0_g1_i1.p1  ORF type:complete len:128 (-),score=10.41 TRINITY_DN31882_c0_g1_i1:146-529(-)